MARVNSKVCKNYSEVHHLVGDKLFVHHIDDVVNATTNSVIYEINSRTVIAEKRDCAYDRHGDSDDLFYTEDKFLVDNRHRLVLKALNEEDSQTLNHIFENIELINSKKDKYVFVGLGECDKSEEEILSYMDEDFEDAVTKVKYEEYSTITTESINGIIFKGVSSKRIERYKKSFMFFGESDDDYEGPANAGNFGSYEKIS